MNTTRNHDQALERLQRELADLLPLSEAVNVAGEPDRRMSPHGLMKIAVCPLR